jgi:predicted small lipoprotein YifL
MLNRLPVRTYAHTLVVIVMTFTVSACGIKGGLYLAPNQLPNAKPPAGAEGSQPRPATDSTIAAESLRNPSTDSPAEMLAN